MYVSKRFLNKDSDQLLLKVENVIGRTKSGEQYTFNLEKEIDGINSNTKDDQPTSGAFRNNTSANNGIDSRQYNRAGVESSTSRLSE